MIKLPILLSPQYSKRNSKTSDMICLFERFCLSIFHFRRPFLTFRRRSWDVVVVGVFWTTSWGRRIWTSNVFVVEGPTTTTMTTRWTRAFHRAVLLLLPASTHLLLYCPLHMQQFTLFQTVDLRASNRRMRITCLNNLTRLLLT